MSIKEKLLSMGMKAEEIDSHESDLYVKKNSISDSFVENYEFKNNVTTFVNALDYTVWYEIPFGYMHEHFLEMYN